MIKVQKERIEKHYNRKVKTRCFAVGDLVWKTVLPLGKKDYILTKWSPNLEGLFRNKRVYSGNAYLLESLEGVCINMESMENFLRGISLPYGKRIALSSKKNFLNYGNYIQKQNEMFDSNVRFITSQKWDLFF